MPWARQREDGGAAQFAGTGGDHGGQRGLSNGFFSHAMKKFHCGHPPSVKKWKSYWKAVRRAFFTVEYWVLL